MMSRPYHINVASLVIGFGLALPGESFRCCQESSSEPAKKARPTFIVPMEFLGPLDKINKVKAIQLEGIWGPRPGVPDGQKWTVAFDMEFTKWKRATSPRMKDQWHVHSVNGTDIYAYHSVEGKTKILWGGPIAKMISYDQYRAWMYPLCLASVIPLKDKKYELSMGAKMNIKDSPCFSVVVTAKDQPKVTLHFHEKSKLLVKADPHFKDPPPKFRSLVYYFSDYKEVGGIKHWHKLEYQYKDNAEKHSEITIHTIRFLERVDEKMFAVPK